MVTRVTNQAQQASALRNIFRITEDLFKANERVATGKRINKPSDDPAGIRDSLSLKTSIAQTKQFLKNMDNNELFLESADSSLDTVGLNLIRARELAIGALSGADTAETRQFAAVEISQIINQVFQSANTKVGNRFIFSGTRLLIEPFQLDPAGSGAVYLGNSSRFSLEIASNQTVEITRPGSEIFATDLNPIINPNTPIADLNGGNGISTGDISITDRSGNNAVIPITAGMSFNDVINTINGTGLNVTASLNSDQTGLLLTESSTNILNPLIISEVNGGSTAASLGILGQRDGSLEGRDLDPIVTANTLISNLDNGNGLNLDQINIVNGAASATISLSTATTIGDVLTTINSAGLNVNASINSTGNALRVVSTDPDSAAIIRNVGLGTTATDLGLGGGRNVFSALEKLQEALQKDDSDGIIASLDNLEAVLNSVTNARADFGAILRRTIQTKNVHESDVVDQEQQLASVEDSDITKEASEIQLLEFALEATLNTSARILQPTLMDFLR